MEKNYSLRHLRYFVCPPPTESLLCVPVCIENRGPRGIEGSRGGSRDGGYILSGGKLCARKLSVRKISARRKCARNPRTFTLFTCCVQAAAAEEGRVARKNIFFVKICIIVQAPFFSNRV